MTTPRAAAVLLLAALTVAPAWAGEPEVPVTSPTIFTRASLDRFVRAAALRPASHAEVASPASQPKRDSILNGALIGAAIGGVGGSALIVAAHGGSDNIPRAMWNVSLGPTLVGLAAGAVIDALR